MLVMYEYLHAKSQLLDLTAHCIISFIFTWTHTFRTIISNQQSVSIAYYILSLKKSTFLTVDITPVMQNILSQTDHSHFNFHIKMFNNVLDYAIHALRNL
jgi:hypothetical protein